MSSKASWSRLNEEAGVDEASAKRIARYVDKDIKTLSNCKPALLAEKAAVTVDEAEKAIAWAKIQPAEKPAVIHQTVITHRSGGVDLGVTDRRDIQGDVVGRDKVQNIVNGVPVVNDTPNSTPDLIDLDMLETIPCLTTENAVALCKEFRTWTEIGKLSPGMLRGAVMTLSKPEAAAVFEFARSKAWGAISIAELTEVLGVPVESANILYEELWTWFELANQRAFAVKNVASVTRELAEDIIEFAKGKVVTLGSNNPSPSRGHAVVMGNVNVDHGKFVGGDDNSGRGGMPQSFYDPMDALEDL